MPYVIAEIGFSHNGDMNLATRMIEKAAECGVDAVKFQSFFADDLYFPNNEIHAIFKAGETSVADHALLKKTADANGVDFLSTPFSPYWVDVLESLDTAGFKIASMDVNNPVLLKAVAQKGRRVYLSTGAATLGEIKSAIKLLWDNGARDVVVFHCVSNYPTLPQDAALSMIPALRDELGIPIGFSDHTLGIAVPIAAVALGAVAVEKHFTIDKNLPGPDHKISADPAEMTALVTALKDVEAAMALAPFGKTRADAEKKKVMRRGIYAGVGVKKGEIITLESLRLVRPEVTPLEKMGKFIGKPAPKDYLPGDPL
jgi:sialic acid synthase SpsE